MILGSARDPRADCGDSPQCSDRKSLRWRGRQREQATRVRSQIRPTAKSSLTSNMCAQEIFRTISGSICAPLGFKAAAVFCGIKSLGTGKGSEKGAKRDLGLIVSDVPAAVAGMFTTNKVCAPPVRVSAKCAARQSARAVVVNSGNANACTGRQGLRDAERMARITAETVAAVYSSRRSATEADDRRNSLHSAVADRRYKSIDPNDIMVCSTGRIGIPMPMRVVERGIHASGPRLARSDRSAREVAEAIMTSDTRRKEIAVVFKINRKLVHIGGICKGAGMIQTQMAAAKHATML